MKFNKKEKEKVDCAPACPYTLCTVQQIFPQTQSSKLQVTRTSLSVLFNSVKQNVIRGKILPSNKTLFKRPYYKFEIFPVKRVKTECDIIRFKGLVAFLHILQFHPSAFIDSIPVTKRF